MLADRDTISEAEWLSDMPALKSLPPRAAALRRRELERTDFEVGVTNLLVFHALCITLSLAASLAAQMLVFSAGC